MECKRGLPIRILSVRLSNACTVTKRKKDLLSTGPRWSEIANFEPIFARSASAVTPSEKKFN